MWKTLQFTLRDNGNEEKKSRAFDLTVNDYKHESSNGNICQTYCTASRFR